MYVHQSHMSQTLRNVKKLYHNNRINPLPEYKILDWFKLKQIADDILKCI